VRARLTTALRRLWRRLPQRVRRSVSALVREAMAETDPNARTLAPAPRWGLPASELLVARLDPADVAAVEAVLEGSERAYWDQADALGRKQLTVVYGVWHRIPAVLEKTGLRPDMPPEDVHAMARGPLAAGGAVYYADLLGAAMQRVGADMADVRRGLDFGCSSGRVVRALAATWPQAEWHGCDPNAGAIAWAEEHLPGIAFLRSPQDPPLPYEDGTFDFVTAISIWSHYGEQAAIVWLDEMHRIVAPGGRLLLTAHGPHSVAHYASERHPAQLERIRAALYREGFWFADEFGAEGDWGVKHPQWGTSFLSAERLLAHACPRWAVEDLGIGANAGNQDLYVLRRATA
jgi:SAM-dependent methyltransferase